MSIHSTKGIVLKTVKYGETSVIATIFTELFGLQSYLVNGVRVKGKATRAHFFQPGSLLDLQVYHHELKNLQRIREIRWAVVYQHIFSEVTWNSVALFMVELLSKVLRQPEQNEALFDYCEQSFLYLDHCQGRVTANFPIFFAIRLLPYLGFRIQDNYSATVDRFHAQEGNFYPGDSGDPLLASREVSQSLAQFLKIKDPADLKEIALSQALRKEILQEIEKYYRIHLPDFTQMKTLPILHEILA